ncbi:MAG: glycosyltransferase family 39 protein [Gaiellaceae bacterium]
MRTRRSVGRLAVTMSSPGVAVAALTVIAALLRFPTLDAKSFWVDEVVTVSLVRQDFGSMLEAIPSSESTPPVYYVLAWVWSQAFGVGEVGLRSLSALLGTAVVPVAYLATRELSSNRAGTASAALVAVNPLLVWYSQEARAYTLLVLLGGLSYLFFARSLRQPRPRSLVFWVFASALALATHYFALFLVIPEAIWLLIQLRRRRAAVLAAVSVACVGLVLLPLALQQLENPRWIAESGLGSRLVQIPAIFLIGFEIPLPYAFAAATVAGALAAVGFWLLVRRADPTERGRGFVAAGIGAAAVVFPALLSILGLDYVVYKNVIAAVFPLTLAVAVGLAARRAGRLGFVALTALVTLSAALASATLWEPKYHREDWRRAAEAIGPARGPHAIVVTPLDGALPLELYLGASRQREASGRLRISEIDLVAGARRPLGSIAEPQTPRPSTPTAPDPRFRVVERVEADRFTLIRYRSATPVSVSIELLRAVALDSGRVAVLFRSTARVDTE